MSFDIHTTLKSNNIVPKTVAIMGPRPSELAGYDNQAPYNTLFLQLINLVEELVTAGTSVFTTDGSQGIAMLSFWAADDVKSRMTLSNELYLPCEQQNAKWNENGPFGNMYYHTMKSNADKVFYHTTLPKDASYKDIAATFRSCDETIIDNSDLLVALYPSYDWMNDAKDETALSIKHALVQKKPVLQCLFEIKDSIPHITGCIIIK